MQIKHPFRVVAAAAAGLLGTAGMAVPALASTTHAATPSASGDTTVAIGRMVFNAQGTGSGDKATGTISVAGNLMPLTAPGLGFINQVGAYSISGPVSCLHVQGDEAGMLIQMTSATGTAVKVMKGMSMLITVKEASNGSPAAMGFVGPIPTGLTHSCAPAVAFLNAQNGSVTVNP